jgi:hypothetical protein
VIARSFLEQIIDRRRNVVGRRIVMSDDPLIVGELESWLELETRDAIHVDGHQVEPRRRHLHRQLLPAAAVASGKE